MGPEPAGEPTASPIVLHHGFDASPTNRWGFNGVEAALEADGHDVHVTSVAPYDTVADRADQLADQIDAVLESTGAEKVNIVAHSMGGLDARRLISALGYGDRVASLTTISTPHRGSNVADVILALLPGKADRVVNALAEVWGRTFSDFADDPDLRGALTDISEANAGAFNDAHPDDDRVFYQSWAGVSSAAGIWNPNDLEACDHKSLVHDGFADVMDATLVPMAAATAHGLELRPNDGMVTVRSAQWGVFQGCIPADHLDEVGQIGDVGANPFSGFDHLRFYRNVAFGLAEMGF